MELTAQQIIIDLIENFKLTPEFLAARLGVKVITIERWKNDAHSPSAPALKYLRQVHNGYKSQNQDDSCKSN